MVHTEDRFDHKLYQSFWFRRHHDAKLWVRVCWFSCQQGSHGPTQLNENREACACLWKETGRFLHCPGSLKIPCFQHRKSPPSLWLMTSSTKRNLEEECLCESLTSRVWAPNAPSKRKDLACNVTSYRSEATPRYTDLRQGQETQYGGNGASHAHVGLQKRLPL